MKILSFSQYSMKQSSLFSYLKKTIASDSKPPNKSQESPQKTPPKLAKPSKTAENREKTPEDRDLQRALKESLKLSQEEDPRKPLKRLKKAAEIRESPQKLPQKLGSKKKDQFLEQTAEIEASKMEMEKIIADLSKEELEMNFERFKFSKTPTTIESMFKKTAERNEKNKEISPFCKEKQGKQERFLKYITVEDEKKQENTEELTEELVSEREDSFFEQFNREKTKENLENREKSKSNNRGNPAKPREKPIEVFTKPISVEKSEGKSQKKPAIGPNNNNGPLNKLTFVITGVLDGCERETLTNILKSQGAKVTGNVSSKTTYLIAGSKLEDGRPTEMSSKYRKAEGLKTKILREFELDELLSKKTGKSLSELVNDSLLKPLAVASPTKPAISPSKNMSSYIKKPVSPKRSPAKSPTFPAKSQDTLLWTHKHAPQSPASLIGNGENIKKIADWLKDWRSVVLKGEKKELQKPRFFGKGSQAPANVNARACLISGPPGIGKTASVRVLAKTLNFDIIERNASDIRNKNSINTLLGDLKTNSLISQGQNREKTPSLRKDFVIVMDEVDGMSSDRGGSQALIEIIKSTQVPIICICNDRQHPKMRTLANHCYDIRFQRPQKQAIAKRVQEICGSEGFSIDINSIELLCESLGNDIRQILTTLEMHSRSSKTASFFQLKNKLQEFKKDSVVMLSNFDAASKFLNKFEHRKLDFHEKMGLFFIDYDFIPLLIQENYLNACQQNIELETLVKTAELIALGDNVISAVRRNNEWGLMQNYALASTIFPSFLSANSLPFPKFPEFLGKNSSQRKIVREIKELKVAMGANITGDRQAVKFEYSEGLLSLLLYNLTKSDGDNTLHVQDTLHVMEYYRITPELLKENLLDVQFNPKKLDLLSEIPTQTKSSLTRLYNKMHKDTLRGKKVARNSENDMEIEGIRDPLYEENVAENIEEEEIEGKEEESEENQEKNEGLEEGDSKKSKKKTENSGKKKENVKKGKKKL